MKEKIKKEIEKLIEESDLYIPSLACDVDAKEELAKNIANLVNQKVVEGELNIANRIKNNTNLINHEASRIWLMHLIANLKAKPIDDEDLNRGQDKFIPDC